MCATLSFTPGDWVAPQGSRDEPCEEDDGNDEYCEDEDDVDAAPHQPSIQSLIAAPIMNTASSAHGRAMTMAQVGISFIGVTLPDAPGQSSPLCTQGEMKASRRTATTLAR